MVITGRLYIELASATNHLPLGWWSETVEYQLSELGVPVVKVKDGTAAGFSAYALIADKVTLSGTPPTGTPPPAAPHEWKLVPTDSFRYMVGAYIERLQFEAAEGGGFFIENGQLWSKRGMVGNQEVDYSGQANFEPFIIIDGNTGVIISKKALIRGRIESGSITDDAIVIDPEKSELQFHSQGLQFIDIGKNKSVRDESYIIPIIRVTGTSGKTATMEDHGFFTQGITGRSSMTDSHFGLLEISNPPVGRPAIVATSTMTPRGFYLTYSDAERIFEIDLQGNRINSALKIIAKNLPTSDIGLETGQLYNSNGYLRIKQ